MRSLFLGITLLATACSSEEAPAPAEPAPKEAPAEAKAPKAKVNAKAKAATVDLTTMNEEQQLAYLMKHGENVYKTGGSSGVACLTCHQATGQGMPPAFPPLVGQKEHMGNCKEHAALIINGLSGKITVDGIEYNGVMPPQANMSDLDIAAVTTYVRMSWGNDYGMCLPEAAAAARKK